jgi:hypothetical protein
VRSSAAFKVAAVPHYHRHPFDRLLIVDAMTEPADFHSAGTQLAEHCELVVAASFPGGPNRWIATACKPHPDQAAREGTRVSDAGAVSRARTIPTVPAACRLAC